MIGELLRSRVYEMDMVGVLVTIHRDWWETKN